VVRQCKYESVHLYAAVNPLTGASSCMVGSHVCTELMSLHLRWIGEEVGPRRHVVLVLDNAGWHHANDLEVPRNITLHFLPPYSPELNPVEVLWLWMREHDLSNRIYPDKQSLKDAGCKAFQSLTAERIKTVCNVPWLVHEK
jgi:transposase